jgi:hypothetical protein
MVELKKLGNSFARAMRKSIQLGTMVGVLVKTSLYW